MRRIGTVILLALLAATAACRNDAATDSPEKPKIVEVFACSDNCPGPEEQYMKRVYEGVSDAQQCRRLGGQPLVIVGWGERTICVAP